jgi:adenosine deaminase
MKNSQSEPPVPPDPWFHRIPKVELHLHLEGAIPLPTLWTLVQKYGGSPDTPDLAALEARFLYRDFPHFIDTWVWKNQFLREYEDFTLIAEAVARDLLAQNIRYVEAYFSPGDFARVGLTPQDLAVAIRKGLSRVPEIEIPLVPDLIRDFGPERGARCLEAVHEVVDQGILGVGIGGSEHAYPPEPWQEVFERARELGLRTSCHAGEAAGASSVWGAVRSLKADRIGHGTRAIENAALMEHLASHGIPVEMCPLSNVATGVVPSAEEHPIRKFFDAGVRISVNTDDPKMFGNSMALELEMLEARHGFSRGEIQQLVLGGIETSWMPENRKKLMREEFEAHPEWSRRDRPGAGAHSIPL